MRNKRTHKFSEPTYVVNAPGCCNGYGYIELVDMDYEAYDRVACHCPAGKRWSGKAA